MDLMKKGRVYPKQKPPGHSIAIKIPLETAQVVAAYCLKHKISIASYVRGLIEADQARLQEDLKSDKP